MDADITIDDRGKLNNDYDFFDRLRQAGQFAAQQFLDDHFDDLGRKSTIDLTAEPAADPVPPELKVEAAPTKKAASC
jgi:hypothetical protein